MTNLAVKGHMLKVGVGVFGAALPVTTRLALQQCGVRKIPLQVFPDNEMAGQLDQRSESVAEGPYKVSGAMAWAPRPDELTAILPLIFGGAFSGNTLDPAYLTQYFPLTVDRKIAVYNHTDCRTSKATFSSSASQLLKLNWEVEALAQAKASADSFPAIDLSILQPYIHNQAVITIDGTARPVDNVEVMVDNMLDTERFFTSSTRTELPQGGRNITFSCDSPFTTGDIDLNEIALAGVAATIVYTNGGRSLTFAFPCLQIAPELPGLEGSSSELRQRLVFTARTLDGDAIPNAIQIINDATA